MASNRVSSLHTNLPTGDRMPGSPASATASPDRGRLQKPHPKGSHSRSSSAQYFTPVDASQPSLQQLQQGYAGGAPSPLLPPPVIGAGSYSRSSSVDRSRPGTPGTPSSRPSTPTIVLPGQSPVTPTGSGVKEHKKKKSFFGSSKKDDDTGPGPAAWIAGHPQRLPYDAQGLVNGRPMQDLWDETDGNCYVYLFPRGAGKGASFKVDSAVFASSPALTRLAFGDVYSNAAIQSGGDRRHQLPLDLRTQSFTLNDPSTPPSTPPQAHRTPGKTNTMTSTSSSDSRGQLSSLSSDGSSEAHLYIPIKLKTDGNFNVAPPANGRSKDKTPQPDPAMEDLQALIDIHNFFAFLCGGPLIATVRKHSLFHIFMTIAGILRTYEFSNLDGSTFGEIASSSFDSYVEELGLADVRTSREKTIEGLVLSERMKSVFLFNEAFTHAAGKHDELMKYNSTKYELISSIVQNRLTRAAMDLDKRTASIRLTLTDFDFTSLFIGTMSSKTSDERKEGVRFEAWKEGFMAFRKNLLAMLKTKYGAWPPKASSKKNDLETSGLNRLVLVDLYRDMSSLYDLIVDRTNLTTRTVDGVTLEPGIKEEPTVKGLRAVLSEYDRSSPPVKPPIPFDLPILPTIKTTRPDFGQDKKKDVKSIQKKLKDDEIAAILRRSWNEDAKVTPFVNMFREMEQRAAHGCTIAEIVDLRIGQWIFMYVVLQTLPMLACDAPGLKWTKGVEYFLCEPPRGGVPWANPNAGGAQASAGAGRTWFTIEGGGGVVSLPSDVVQHGVEGIYRRSHCWTMAEQWTSQNPILNTALHEQEAMNAASMDGNRRSADLPAPSPLLDPNAGARSRSGDRTSKRHSSLGIGLEALPLPVGVTPDGLVPSAYPTSGYPSPGGFAGPGSRPVTPDGGRPKSAHVVDASKTFDAILGGTDLDGKKKKKR